jgi:hypothetical protein
MKTLSIAVLLTSLSTILLSQDEIFPIDNSTGRITYSEVVQVDSVDSRELFVRARSWFAHTFISAQNVIQLEDKEAGRIIGKGVFAIADNVDNPTVMNVHVSGTVDFTVEVLTKDGRYKYIISDLSFKLLGMQERDLRSSILASSGTYKNKMNLRWLEVRQNTNYAILEIIGNLKKAMVSSAELEW